eukprot:TRINITY_DN3162_c0_g1_i7.p1 TRINITY_DN3162_c0_g1~~TRINITY_DN3162_c0_g1_i7.p1  ORF type:complete len:157 (-),score=13.75 TRINITY_DN3162_c0_g1_i7:108-578(-)
MHWRRIGVFQLLGVVGSSFASTASKSNNRRSSVVSASSSQHTFRSAARLHLHASRGSEDDARSIGGMSQGTDASTLSKALNKLKTKGTSSSRAASIKPRSNTERASSRVPFFSFLLQSFVDIMGFMPTPFHSLVGGSDDAAEDRSAGNREFETQTS